MLKRIVTQLNDPDNTKIRGLIEVGISVFIFLLLLLGAPLAFAQDAAEMDPSTEDFFVPRLLVLDSRNFAVGMAQFAPGGDRGELAVALRVADQIVILNVRREGFQEFGGTIGFASTDCSGQPYLLSGDAPTLFAQAAITEPGQTLWVPIPGAPQEPIFVESVRVSIEPEGDQDGCDQTPPNPTFATPAQDVIDLAELFIPPFHLVSRDPRLPRHTHRQTKGTHTGPPVLID